MTVTGNLINGTTNRLTALNPKRNISDSSTKTETDGLLSNKEDIISIANTWNDLLNVNINKSTIRQHVLDNFSSDKMFYQYEKLLNISN